MTSTWRRFTQPANTRSKKLERCHRHHRRFYRAELELRWLHGASARSDTRTWFRPILFWHTTGTRSPRDVEHIEADVARRRYIPGLHPARTARAPIARPR